MTYWENKFPKQYKRHRDALLKVAAWLYAAVERITVPSKEEEVVIFKGVEIDARSLANIALAMFEMGESPYSSHLQECIHRLQNSPDAGCWGTEVWDTALALRALYSTREVGEDISKSVIKKSVNWLCDRQRKHVDDKTGKTTYSGWHDEPWETALTVIALAPLRGTEFDICIPSLEERLDAALRWLITQENTATGELLNPQYTALLLKSFLAMNKLDSKEAKAAQRWLLESGSRHIWFDNYEEMWANCWATLALIDSGVHHDDPAIKNAIDWIVNQLGKKGELIKENYEDMSLAAITLYKYLAKVIADSVIKDMNESERREQAAKAFLTTSMTLPKRLEIERVRRKRMPRVMRTKEGINIFLWNSDIVKIVSVITVVSAILAIIQFFLK